MIITTKIKMDLQLTKNLPVVNAVQTDTYARNLEIDLFSGRQPFQIPQDATVVICFRKADGKGGEYDTLPDGSAAWSTKQNTLTVALAPQVLTFPGRVDLTVAIVRGDARVNTFAIPLEVAPIATAISAISDDYFNTAAQIRQVVDEYLAENPPVALALPRLTVGTVKTLDPDAAATASITGTVKTPVLNLGIPGPYPMGDGIYVPEHWQSALDTGAKAINTAMQAAGYNKSAFLFYSDAHWNYGSQMSPTLLRYLHRHTGMVRTFFGGDIVNAEGTDYDTMAYLWDWRSQLKELPNHHSVVGNHDDGNPTTIFDVKYVYSYLLAAEETSDMVRGDGLYYYIDSPAEKTRYLCLDTAYKGLTDKQSAFVKDALLSTPEGWHIVAVSHIWVDPDYSVTPAVPGDVNPDAAVLLAMFDSYNARSGEYADCGGWVEFCIGGHTHWDYDTASPNGIPVILVETDSKHVRSGLTYKTGTTSEASVNGIIADYDAHQIHVVRIGRGQSRDVEIVNYVVNYTNVLPLALDADGVSIYNAGATPGYKADTRWSTSGQAESTQSGTYLSGWIPISAGDVIRPKNVTMLQGAGTSILFLTDTIGKTTASQDTTNITTYYSGQWDDSGNLTQFTIPDNSGFSYMRIQCTGFTAASIITINELID